MSTTEIIHARDFESTPTSPTYDRWTLGKLRHLIAALDELDDRTVIAQVSYTGFAVVGVIRRAFYAGAGRGARVVIATEAGTTAYRVAELGAIVLMPTPAAPRAASARHRAVALMRAEGMAAVRRAQAEHGADRKWGNWQYVPTEDGMYVTYEPHTGNPAFADKCGKRGMWEYRSSDLQAVPST
jgi:hypothetical protein